MKEKRNCKHSNAKYYNYFVINIGQSFNFWLFTADWWVLKNELMKKSN